MTPSDSEKYLERKLVDLTRKAGGWCIKIPADWNAGLPDRVCLFPQGRVIFVELKSRGKKPREIQKVMHRKLRTLGFRVEVVDSLDKLKDLFKDDESE